MAVDAKISQRAEKHEENAEFTNSTKFLAEEEERPKTKQVRQIFSFQYLSVE